MTPPSPNPTPAGGEDELRQRHCIHWFVNKSTLGAPGTAWQECEMCGMKLKDIIAASNQQAVQKARFEEIRLAVKAGAITDTYASMRVAHLAAAQPRKDERDGGKPHDIELRVVRDDRDVREYKDVNLSHLSKQLNKRGGKKTRIIFKKWDDVAQPRKDGEGEQWDK